MTDILAVGLIEGIFSLLDETAKLCTEKGMVMGTEKRNRELNQFKSTDNIIRTLRVFKGPVKSKSKSLLQVNYNSIACE